MKQYTLHYKSGSILFRFRKFDLKTAKNNFIETSVLPIITSPYIILINCINSFVNVYKKKE